MTEGIVLQPGQPVEVAHWFCGMAEKDKARAMIRRAMRRLEESAHVVLGPVSWREMTPDEANAPEPPADAPRGTMLLIGEATVRTVLQVAANDDGFVHELEPGDLARLRQITRKAYAKANPGQSLSDVECDQVINRIGPESAARALTLH